VAFAGAGRPALRDGLALPHQLGGELRPGGAIGAGFNRGEIGLGLNDGHA
jgi:hypothetical protein